MSRVFLSYARDDERRARQVAGALERAGHEVWWDRHLGSGSRFTEEIEQALVGAEAVIVLWSKASVASPWVRDEAAVGRDAGRLVPARIEDVEPPLGFRQYQTSDLSRWQGAKTPGFKEILQAVAAQAPAPASVPFLTQPGRREQRSGWLATLIGLGISAAILVAVVGWGVSRGPPVPTISVSAADRSAESDSLAHDLLVKLGTLQTAKSHPIRLVPADGNAAKASYALKVSASRGPEAVASTVVLEDANDQSLLWSQEFKQPPARIADLKQQIGVASAHVLGCVLEGLSEGSGRPNQQILKSYLTACADFAEESNIDSSNLLPEFLDVIRKAPRLRGAWAKLLLLEGAIVGRSYLPEAQEVASALPQHIAQARKIDPNMPEALAAEAALLPQNAFERRLSLLHRAAQIDPENADILSVQSEALRTVGRGDDAVRAAQRASELDPLSPNKREQLISMLSHTGNPNLALQELRKAEELWPGASSLIQARFAFDLRYGDPNEAMRLQKSGLILNVPGALFLSYLEARLDPSSEKIDRAVEVGRSLYEQFPGGIFHYAQVLGTFGREEELYRILLRWQHPDEVNYVTDVLFRPTLRKFRRDPRMMQVAARLGLLDYWKRTGEWPDFCLDDDLRYDCKAEAAKL